MSKRGASSDSVVLDHGPWQVMVLPDLGGAIGRCRWRHPDGRMVDLLRPISDADLAAHDVEGAACFPLLPFSNRIRDGRFSFAGRTVAIPRNTAGKHPEHGHGWQRPWSVLARDATGVTIGYSHHKREGSWSTWPYAYEARQSISIGAAGLEFAISARNLDTRPMPFGFGLHPYFPRTPRCTLRAEIGGFWQTDAEVLPVKLIEVPAPFDVRRGLAMDGIAIDNAFAGWSGAATIEWPEQRTRLHLAATEPLRFLVVYVPDAATEATESAVGRTPYFCAEPVSNMTDAFNQAAAGRRDTGMIVLEPGARIEARLCLSPEPTG